MIDPTGAAARLVRAKDALLAAQKEVEAAQIALDTIDIVNVSIEDVVGCIRRITDGYEESQLRRFIATFADLEPEEWSEQAMGFKPESLRSWLSGKTIVGNNWILGRYNSLRKASSGNYTLWGFATELIKNLPKDTSIPPVILRRPDPFSIAIAFATIDESVNTAS